MGARPWRLLLDPPGSAAWNMCVDEALLARVPEAPPTLRFYSWAEPSLSLGYRQPAPAWRERAEELGLQLVRRITGGGTVLHAGDLTYALAAPRSCPELPADLRGSCEWIREVLLSGLRSIGVRAQASPTARGAERLDLCFAGATGLEIELDRAKWVGSAQRRTRTGYLQHGSIRLSDDSALYAALLGERLHWPRESAKLELAEVREALCRAFARALGGRLELGSLAEPDLNLARIRHATRLRDCLAVPPLP